MKKIKLIAVALLCAAGLCVLGMAQSPVLMKPLPKEQQATDEQIVKLLDSMRIEDQMASIMDMLPMVVKQQMQSQREALSSRQLTPEQEEQVEKFLQRRLEKTLNLYPIEEIIADIVPVYQKFISREDADVIIEFYRTPAAQRLIDSQPAMAQEYLPLLMARMETRVKAFTEETSREAQALLKELLGM